MLSNLSPHPPPQCPPQGSEVFQINRRVPGIDRGKPQTGSAPVSLANVSERGGETHNNNINDNNGVSAQAVVAFNNGSLARKPKLFNMILLSGDGLRPEGEEATSPHMPSQHALVPRSH